MVFCKEYREFIGVYGSACANGHELMGICEASNLSIVERTNDAKGKNPNIPTDLYLIEDLGIDKILTWQNSKGELFQTVGNGLPEKLEIDLCTYVDE